MTSGDGDGAVWRQTRKPFAVVSLGAGSWMGRCGPAWQLVSRGTGYLPVKPGYSVASAPVPSWQVGNLGAGTMEQAVGATQQRARAETSSQVGRIVGGLVLLAPAAILWIVALLLPTLRTFSLS